MHASSPLFSDRGELCQECALQSGAIQEGFPHPKAEEIRSVRFLLALARTLNISPFPLFSSIDTMDKQRGDLYESVFYDASDLLEDAIQELAQTYGVDHQTVVNFILVLTTFVETIRRSNLHLLQASRHDTQLALARWPRCGSVEDSFEGVYHDEAEDEAEDDEEHGGHDEDDEEEEEEEISDDWGDNETLSDDSDEVHIVPTRFLPLAAPIVYIVQVRG